MDTKIGNTPRRDEMLALMCFRFIFLLYFGYRHLSSLPSCVFKKDFCSVSRWFIARGFLDYPVHCIARQGSRVQLPGTSPGLPRITSFKNFGISVFKMGVMIGPAL